MYCTLSRDGVLHRLLEVSEHECRCEVLLTLKNLVDVRRSPAPCSLQIIPRSMPLEIVGGEHFVTTDMLDLLAGRAPSPGDPEAEPLSREQALLASSIPLTSTNRGSSSALPVAGLEAGSVCPAGLPLLRKRIDPAPRVLTIKKKRTTKGKSARGGPGGRFYTLGSFLAQPTLSLGGGRDDGISRSLCRQKAKTAGGS